LILCTAVGRRPGPGIKKEMVLKEPLVSAEGPPRKRSSARDIKRTSSLAGRIGHMPLFWAVPEPGNCWEKVAAQHPDAKAACAPRIVRDCARGKKWFVVAACLNQREGKTQEEEDARGGEF